VLEQIDGDVAEDDFPSATLESAEGDQAVAGADVEERLPGLERGTLQHAVTRLTELGGVVRHCIRVTAEAPAE